MLESRRGTKCSTTIRDLEIRKVLCLITSSTALRYYLYLQILRLAHLSLSRNIGPLSRNKVRSFTIQESVALAYHTCGRGGSNIRCPGSLGAVLCCGRELLAEKLVTRILERGPYMLGGESPPQLLPIKDPHLYKIRCTSCTTWMEVHS